jgi:pSer/pThr/pTyr-binding forkhead associated (FHA) protein
MWRRRRESAPVGPARAEAPGRGTAGAGPGGAAGRRFAWRRRARRMDRRSAAQVVLTASPEYSRSGIQDGLVPAPVAWPTEGRLGTQMPSIYCTGCGRANPEEARFCSHCGTSLGYGTGERGTETTSIIAAAGGEQPDAEPGDDLADPATLAALPPGTALLVVRRGPNAGSRFLLDGDLTTAGRHPESDIFLDDVTVSRRHAEFYRHGGGFTVRDVGSLNGTYVNRERIEETDLSGGDEVQVGKFRLVFLLSPRTPVEYGGGGAQVGG